MNLSWPIVVVTGANGGIGFGICHRLLVQLSQKNPPDVEAPLKAEMYQHLEGTRSCAGLTIIMACRCIKRATVAREKLFGLLDADIEKQKKQPDYDGYAESFRQNVRIEIHRLDLAVMETIFDFGDQLSQKYPYVSHLICNAGVASYTAVDHSAFLKQVWNSFGTILSNPKYDVQRMGELSADGLGWVWQCNVFGHYALFRTIQPLFLASRCPHGPRVLWMSSLKALPEYFDSTDLQLLKTKYSYEGSKYQIDLIATQLDHRSYQALPKSPQIRHFIVDPGVASTNIAAPLLNFFTYYAYLLLLYGARLFGLPFYTITPHKAAVSAVQLSFIPLSLVSSFAMLSPVNPGKNVVTESTSEKHSQIQPLRFCSITDWWGRERVGANQVKQWSDHEKAGGEMVFNDNTSA